MLGHVGAKKTLFLLCTLIRFTILLILGLLHYYYYYYCCMSDALSVEVKKDPQKDSESLNTNKDKLKQFPCGSCKELIESEGVECDVYSNWFHTHC